MKIPKESDKLNQEYKSLSRLMERLTHKYAGPELEARMNQIFQRQSQIIKELEECTGIQITCPTIEDTLKENKRIQEGE